MSFHIVMFISLLLPYLCCLWPAGGKSKVPLQYFGPSGNAGRSGNIQAMQLFHSATRSQLLDCIDLAFSTQFRVALTSKAPPGMEQGGEFSMKSSKSYYSGALISRLHMSKVEEIFGPDFPHCYLVF